MDTVTYDYDDSAWGDLLTTYDGSAITYDVNGNPLDDGTWEYTWEHGRQLESMTDGSTTWSYTYDADGMRTGKTDGTTSYSYVYNGGQLSRMTVTTQVETADGQTTTQTHTVDLTYDASGNPQTMTYDGVTYYYTVNIQGDVTGIVDESGNVLVRYNYQGYGTTYYYGAATGSVGATLVKINPLTYRGYVYDRETKLYYLQSRYYNRTSGRFINADAYTSTGQGLLGNNMFAYCGNNPVLFKDSHGTSETIAIGAESRTDRIPGKTLAAAAGKVLGYVLVTAVAYAAAKEAVDAEAIVAVKAAKRASRDDNDKIYTVYFLRDAKNPSGGIVYVGRVKTANFGARMTYHGTRGRALVWQIDGLTYYQCRGLEQVGMAYFHTINRNRDINNQIRGVSPLNGARRDYFGAAKVFWGESGSEYVNIIPDSYWLNWTENEFLNGGM